MRIRVLAAAVLLVSTAPGVAAAQRSAATAEGRALPGTAPRASLVLRSDVKGEGDRVPNASLADHFDDVVDGINANGVARLSVFVTPTSGYACTGALVAPSVMLTAAHCVTDDLTGAPLTADDMIRARFVGPGDHAFDRWSRHVVVRPEWKGLANPLTNGGHDVALVFLRESAAPWMTRYDLFAGDAYDPWFGNVDFIGYGESGNGWQGVHGFDGRRRWGRNRIDYVSDLGFDPADPGVLWTDFDSGRRRDDAFCWAAGVGDAPSPLCDAGRGPTEFGLGAGDSGGPLFLDGRIVGVASFGTYFCGNESCSRPAAPPLFDPDHLAGWGSLNGYASVAYNADWIAAQLAAGAPAAVAAPEPTSLALTLGGAAALGAVRRRRRPV